MESTLERIVPDESGQIAGQDTVQLHLARYHFAEKFARGHVLDIACGVGYGAHLLAQLPAVESVTAVDISPEALAIAQQKYRHPKVTFIQSDCMTFSTSTPISCIVSLETVEHLPQPVAFLSRMASLLTSGGTLVSSVPVTPSVDFNPYHLHDFSQRRFTRIMRDAGLDPIDRMLQIQPYNPFAALRRKEARMADARRSLLAFYAKHPSKFFLRFGSVFRHGFKNKYLTLASRKAS